MKNRNLVEHTRGAARLGKVIALLGACALLGSSAGCAEVEPGTAGDNIVATPDGGGGGTPGGGSDATAPAPVGDSGGGSVTPGAEAGTTPAVVTSDAGAGGGGSLDTPWCKAKAVLEKKCVTCHDGQASHGTPDKIAFNNLSNLQADSKVAGSKYYQRIGVRISDAAKPMPPTNDLSSEDKQILQAWVAAGGAAGANPTCTPVGGAGVDAGGPTVVDPSTAAWPADCEKRYTILSHDPSGADKPFIVPKGKEIHPQIIFDAPWGDTEVQALAMRPITDNKKVLHHWILYEAKGSAFITGWAPGQDGGGELPPDVGMYIAKGSQSLRLDLHYYNLNGTQDEPDRSGVDVCIVTKAKFRKNTATIFNGFASMGNLFVMVPKNKLNHAITGVCNVSATQPVTLLTASPHAHTLAKSMKFTAKVSGQEVIMHDLPFNFEEQRSLPLKAPVVLKTGDTVSTTCVYDNKTNQDVTFGENTGNEMCFNFALYYPMGALSCGGVRF